MPFVLVSLCSLFFTFFPAIYTIKTLDAGGYEMEFPSYEFLLKIKELLHKIYPSSKWQEYTTRMVTKLFYDVGKICFCCSPTRHGSTLRVVNRKSDERREIWFFWKRPLA